MKSRNILKATLAILSQIFVATCILSLAACNLPALQTNDIDVNGEGSAAGVTILYPADGAQLQVGDFVDVHSRIADPAGVTAAILTVNNEIFRRDELVSPVASGNMYQPWIPTAPGTYVLQVILETGGGGQQASQPITVIVGDSTTPEIAVTPPVIMETPTATVTPGKPQASANQNTNCRSGPGIAYPHVADFLAGQTVPITGRNQDGTWLAVERPGGTGQCWVWRDLVTIQGNIESVPVVSAPPPPITDTPKPTKTPTQKSPYTACHDYPDLATCNADPMGFGGCSWETGTNRCQP